jgi:transcriptional regulator of NAD metabolism
MENLQDAAELMVKTSEKVEKILQKVEMSTATAVINFVFLKMVLSQDQGPMMAKAMAATFLNNVVNSIDSYYYGKDDNEPVH